MPENKAVSGALRVTTLLRACGIYAKRLLDGEPTYFDTLPQIFLFAQQDSA